jgi:hypothetical protein
VVPLRRRLILLLAAIAVVAGLTAAAVMELESIPVPPPWASGY